MIKIITTIALLLSMSFSYAAVTPSQVKDIIQKLTHIADARRINLHFSEDKEVNAWVECGRNITVTAGAMNKLNYDAMVFMLGHELGHVQLGHVGYKIPFFKQCKFAKYEWKKSEADADIYSINLLTKGKYNACKGGRDLFNYFLNNYGNSGGPLDPHPSNKLRRQIVEEYACEQPVIYAKIKM